ncbi:RNase H domain-containing protein [Trichonephila clavipes]|nr:RNase H domain-containing protein [Trichonephila clavipes]
MSNLQRILNKTEKNTSLKIVREEDSPYESTPVSKRSRRRKTFQASEDMDTDYCCQTPDGKPIVSLLRVYQALILSRLDYGCVVYGSAHASVLRRLDTIHHSALRIFSGAFRTLPVQSFYVTCNQLPLNLRRKKQALAYYFKILSVRSHPLKNGNLTISMKRIYDAWPHNIRPFMERTKLLLSKLDLPDVDIHQRNFLQFQPWNIPRLDYINPYTTYSKSAIAPVTFQHIFAYHRSRYSDYFPIYRDLSKRTDYVGCGVVMEDNRRGYQLDNCCSVFTAEAITLHLALQLIDPQTARKYCIYTDSMSVLEVIENYNDRCHHVVCDIIDITSRLHGKGCDIQFCWIPSHVGITGNEQADLVARSETTELPLTVLLCDMKRVIQHRIDNSWQESWNLQTNNKLHCVKPVIGALPLMPMRRTDVKLTRLRIGHTRFTHRHLLLGENAPECPSCKVPYSVYHILIECPVFSHHRITFFSYICFNLI